MSDTLPTTFVVSDSEITRAIEEWLLQQQPDPSVVSLRRRAWEYATSAPLELVTVETAKGGSERQFVLKHLGPRTLSAGAHRVKPLFVVEPCREIEVYRRVLDPHHIGPALVGSELSPGTGVYWLLIEKVAGCPLYEVGEVASWSAVSRWLGALHDRLATVDRHLVRRQARLIEYDREWYACWLNRALRFFASDDPPRSRRSRVALRWLADRYDKVIDRLAALPPTILHGEFYPSNVLIDRTAGKAAVCPVDWEMTSIGPGIIDLAALTAGQWPDRDRRDMLAAYLAGSGSDARLTVDDVAEVVEYAYIHLAVQWLGWFGRRRAPAEHAYDWLDDATNRAEALGL